MADEYKNGTLNTEFYKTTPDQDKRLSNQKKRMNDICKCLVDDPFSSDKVLSLINEYLTTDRFLYSIVSDFIFKLENDQRPIYLANVELLLLNCPDDSRESILKLYDHASLAVNQFSSLKQSDEEFNSRFGNLFSEKINPIIKDNKKSLQQDVKEVEQKIQKVQEESKSILNQLISIVSIFTAVAFIVFGGITSLKSIFNGINEVPVTKLCLLGSIWGLCLSNLIALFMHFIFTLVKADHTVSIRQDSAIKTGNIVLICIFLVSAVAYFLTKYGLLIYRQIGNVQPVTIIISVLTTIIIGIMIQLLIKSRKNP